jgi:hypothetical protein
VAGARVELTAFVESVLVDEEIAAVADLDGPGVSVRCSTTLLSASTLFVGRRDIPSGKAGIDRGQLSVDLRDVRDSTRSISTSRPHTFEISKQPSAAFRR